MKNIQKLNKVDKIIYILFVIILLTIFILGLFKINNILFLLLSILANFFLILIFKFIIKKLNINFSKKEKISIFISIIFIYLFYFISIVGRKFIYYWDYSCYYNIQLSTINAFKTSLFEGIKYFVGSTWSGEYGNFLSFFPQLIFNFTNKTINAFNISCVLTYTPYIILAFSIMLKKVNKLLKVKDENKVFLLSLITFILFPILHATFIYGQPDLFGLAFIFLIISLTINYDFKKIEVDRLLLILVITFLLLISRRWYLYWIVAYYFTYIVKIIINNYKDKNTLFTIVKNIIIYGIIVILFFGITLFPLIKNILSAGFENQYNYYLTGGFKSEIGSQISYLGYIVLLFIIIGMIYGFISKKTRLLTILNIIQYFIIIILFTKIQNMGLHHSLLLIPLYLYFLYLFIIFILNQKKKVSVIFMVLLLITSVMNFSYGLFKQKDTKLLTKISLKVPNQDDYDEIEQAAKWLQSNLNKNSTAYMITHNNKYNPDKFRNFYMPDKTISNYLPYGSAIIGVHKFPEELFTSKYIITTTPFESVSIEYKYNNVFLKLVENKSFQLIKAFDMKNGYKIMIYERIKEVDEYEINLYKQELADEIINYPSLYKVLVSY